MKSRSPQFFASGGTSELTCGNVTPWSNEAATTGYHCAPFAIMKAAYTVPFGATVTAGSHVFVFEPDGAGHGDRRAEVRAAVGRARERDPAAAHPDLVDVRPVDRLLDLGVLAGAARADVRERVDRVGGDRRERRARDEEQGRPDQDSK